MLAPNLKEPPLDTIEGPNELELNENYPGGAGIFARASNVKLIRSTVEHNRAGNGGGIMMVGSDYLTALDPNLPNDGRPSLDDIANSSATNGSLKMHYSELRNNTSDIDGAGVLALYLNKVLLRHSSVSENSAGNSGAGLYHFGVIRSVILSSHLKSNGGGMSAVDGPQSTMPSVSVHNSLIMNNEAGLEPNNLAEGVMEVVFSLVIIQKEIWI